jgi:hypothetical protein
MKNLKINAHNWKNVQKHLMYNNFIMEFADILHILSSNVLSYQGNLIYFKKNLTPYWSHIQKNLMIFQTFHVVAYYLTITLLEWMSL